MGEMPSVAVIIREPGRAPLRLLVTHEPIDVGRDCRGLLLGDPRISRRHLTLQVVDGVVHVTDRNSMNGSRVDGFSLRGAHAMRPGEIVELGATTISLLDVAAASDAPDPRIRADDTGTLVVVLSSIEHSTRRAEEVGAERWVEVLAVHHSIVRRNVERHGGNEIAARGDGFLMTFPSARRAVGAMIDVQQMLAAHARSHPVDALRVRVGIHMGVAILGDDGNLLSRHVDLASRVADEARGGEILVTGLVRELLQPIAGFRFGDPRIARLGGTERPQRPQRLHPVRFGAHVDSTEPGSPPSRR